MIKKPAVFLFMISTLGLMVITSVFFTSKNLNFQQKPSPASEPFLCNGQPCNVILIIPETLSARHMGIYGYERDTTPFIDEFFGEESLVFKNAWSVSSWTLPSFATLYTSQLPSEIFVEEGWDLLSDSVPTFIDIIAENKIPKFAGVAMTLELMGGMGTVISGGRRELGCKLFTQYEPNEIFISRQNDPLQFQAANEWIYEVNQKIDGQPFFLLLHLFTPHSPYDPPEPYRYFFDAPSEYPGRVTDTDIGELGVSIKEGGKVDAKLQRFRLQYDQEIRYLDNQIESFISRIPEEVRQNTVFIFTSDHGEAFGQHGFLFHQKPLYEEVIHIPFLVRSPGINQRMILEPISLLDIGPTILEIFGLEIPNTFKGLSLLPVLQEKQLKLEKRIVLAEFIDNIQYTDEKQRNGPKARTESLSYPSNITVRKGGWKILKHTNEVAKHYNLEPLELYNLDWDYGEYDNLLLRWLDLSKKEQAEIILLFKALGENPPL